MALEVLRRFEQQPTTPFQGRLTEGVGLTIQLTAQGRELFVEPLDQMKVVQDQIGLGQMLQDRGHIATGHVRRDGFDVGLRSLQTSPEAG